MSRLGNLHGLREVDYETFISGQAGEAIPVASLRWLRSQGLTYPALRAGGEGLLWAEMLASGPALFVDRPIVLYRTDVAQRICTLEYQMEHPADMAAVSDAMVTFFARNPRPGLKPLYARRCMAAGTYHLLAGNTRVGRQRLFSAISLGCIPAIPALAASLAGRNLFRRLFRVYRIRVAKAYL